MIVSWDTSRRKGKWAQNLMDELHIFTRETKTKQKWTLKEWRLSVYSLNLKLYGRYEGWNGSLALVVKGRKCSGFYTKPFTYFGSTSRFFNLCIAFCLVWQIKGTKYWTTLYETHFWLPSVLYWPGHPVYWNTLTWWRPHKVEMLYSYPEVSTSLRLLD